MGYLDDGTVDPLIRQEINVLRHDRLLYRLMSCKATRIHHFLYLESRIVVSVSVKDKFSEM